MPWQERSDLGLEVVAHIHDCLRVSDHWRTDQDRGFTWWPGDFAQRVWAEPGVFHHAATEYAIHAETDFLKGHGKADEVAVSLIDEMDKATLCGPVYDDSDDTYRLCTTVVVTSDNVAWLQHTLLCAIGLQLDEAHKSAPQLASKIGAVVATTGHPRNGLRNQSDPMLGAVDLYFRPAGSPPSKWLDSPEWVELRYAIERQATHMQSDERSWLEAEFPCGETGFGSGVIHLVVNAKDPHPTLGHGLHIDLTMPGTFAPQVGAHLALQLNGMERKEWRRSQFLGSWGVHDDKLGFHSFVPNTAFKPGAMTGLSLSMAIRVEWAQDNFAMMARRLLVG